MLKKIRLVQSSNFDQCVVKSDRTVFSVKSNAPPALTNFANLMLVFCIVHLCIDQIHWFPKILFSVIILIILVIINLSREKYLFRDPKIMQTVLRFFWWKWTLEEKTIPDAIQELTKMEKLLISKGQFSEDIVELLQQIFADALIIEEETSE
jgi:hypothetical protein